MLGKELQKANSLLNHLETSSAPAEFVTAQQDAVAKIQKDYDEESNGLNIITDPEAHIKQLEIDELEQRKNMRLTKIAEIVALLP